MILREQHSQTGIRTTCLCLLAKLRATPLSTTCSSPSTNFRSDKNQEDLEYNLQLKKNDYIQNSVMRSHINQHQILLLEMAEELGTAIHTAPTTTTQTTRVDILAGNYLGDEGVIAVPIFNLESAD
jgi:hypothetical protein